METFNNDILKVVTLSGVEEIESALCALRTCFFNQKLNDNDVIRALAQKYSENAVVFTVLYDNMICGLCAFYCNDLASHNAFLSLIIVDKTIQNKGIGSLLLSETKKYCEAEGMASLLLEVDKKNYRAINFYKKHNFSLEKEVGNSSIYKCDI